MKRRISDKKVWRHLKRLVICLEIPRPNDIRTEFSLDEVLAGCHPVAELSMTDEQLVENMVKGERFHRAAWCLQQQFRMGT